MRGEPMSNLPAHHGEAPGVGFFARPQRRPRGELTLDGSDCVTRQIRLEMGIWKFWSLVEWRGYGPALCAVRRIVRPPEGKVQTLRKALSRRCAALESCLNGRVAPIDRAERYITDAFCPNTRITRFKSI